MKKSILFFCCIFSFAFSCKAGDGEEIFNSQCMACHTIGNGVLVGPDLKNVNANLSDNWLTSFIKSSQKLVQDGDKHAVEVFNKYNQIVMPDHQLSDVQIKSLLDYIKQQSGGSVASTTPSETSTQPTSPSQNSATTSSPVVKNNAQENSNTFFYYLSGITTVLLLFIIWMLAGTIKTLSRTLSKEYEKERALNEVIKNNEEKKN